ncbi:hypothetical protein [Mesorhizobium sp.]|uniref:hypothetical protein n=1 Tax=Mesorhizobium sp. TaxID=1871066 RepID=UPI0011FCAE24|nr:hypothetical protein [Mesorhizobium sp.]TIS35879.1 MAG: hypothetical protein E5W95_24440 [Mesorhizobium sp.]
MVDGVAAAVCEHRPGSSPARLPKRLPPATTVHGIRHSSPDGADQSFSGIDKPAASGCRDRAANDEPVQACLSTEIASRDMMSSHSKMRCERTIACYSTCRSSRSRSLRSICRRLQLAERGIDILGPEAYPLPRRGASFWQRNGGG